MKNLSSVLIVSLNLLAVTDAFSTPIERVALPSLPSWAQDSLYSGTYLNIDEVMKLEGLSRLQAVEVQNQMRDAIESGRSPQDAYDRSLRSVRSGNAESGWKSVQFSDPADFVAVLDLDETLLHQWYESGSSGNYDIGDLVPDSVGSKKSPSYVKFTPYAEEFILALERHPNSKGVAIFSAKLDQAALDLISRWRFSDGSMARSHLAGVFTRNHLVLGPKTLVPSKDLRIFDPELKHVILVDDNPGRVIQPQLLRAQPKFDADTFNRANEQGETAVSMHYESALRNAYLEVRETARAARKLRIPFGQAFTPYSYSGSRVYQSLQKALKKDAQALEATRLNPEFQEATFFLGK